MSQTPPVVEDWTYGPARWIAVGLIVALSAVGLSWSLSGRAAQSGATSVVPSDVKAPEVKTHEVKTKVPSGVTPAAVSPRAVETPAGVPRPVVTELPPAPKPAAVEAVERTKPAVPAGAAAAKININTATQAELESLPNIGPKLAQRILEDRAKNGKYATLKDLDRVSGIGAKTLERLGPLITFE
ncbi:MAG: ComEA family DNA-binding protein [Phycisphaerales bacterium]|nr:ComEA family DNA-binding protein [Phycisphaerales bacterium]